MYTRAYDRGRGLLFALWSGSSNTDEDFDRAAQDIEMLDREGEGRPEGVVHISEAEDANPVPSPSQRKRLTAAAEAISRSRVYYYCMITRSARVRGVITLLSWFVPRPATEVNGCRATFEDALTWIEKHRPGLSGRFRELRREAQDAASRGSDLG